jgi:HK97 family phage prohead protease
VNDYTAPSLIVLIGAPGAGKTTWLRDQLPAAQRVDLEILRREPSTDPAETVKAALAETHQRLNAGELVGFDSTAISPTMRDRLHATAADAGVPIHGVILNPPLEDLLNAQTDREHPVPDDRVRELHSRLQEQLEAIHSENWTTVQTITRTTQSTTPTPTPRASDMTSSTSKQDTEMLETRRTVVNDRELLCADLTSIEIRDSGNSDYFTVTGHAAIFGDVADLGAFREKLMPGSFRGAIDTSLVHLLWNHDANFPLASTDSGTLDLAEDDLGLRVWARVPKALSYAPDLRTLMETGIARGMSFAFTLPSDGSGETWSRSDTESDAPLRTITRVEALYDVSCVTRGAYSAPSFAMRSALESAIERGDLQSTDLSSDVAQADPAGIFDHVAQADPAGEGDVAISSDGASQARASQLAALQQTAAIRRRVATARSQQTN